MAFLSGYTKRKEITIGNAYVSADLTDFPFNVTLVDDPEIGSFIDSQGLNIRFTSDDGTTELSYERQSFSINGSNEASGTFWVKIPQITSSSGAIIYLYYKDGVGVDGEDKTNVWDSNYVGVWHMETDPSNPILDSTAGAHDLASDGSMNSGDVVAGIIGLGNGIDFNGVDEGLTSNDPDFNLTDSITLEAWGRIKESIEDESIYHKWDSGNGYTLQSSGNMFLAIGAGGSTQLAYTNTVLLPNADYYMCGTFDGSTMQCYIDGVTDGSPVFQVGLDNSGNSLCIARRSDVSGNTDAERTQCRFDELRISSVARSTEWIYFTHKNINGLVHVVGSEEIDGIFNEIGSGGVAADSAAALNIILNPTPSGGVLTAGTIVLSLRINPILSGGLLAAGTIVLSSRFNPTHSGGVLTAGTIVLSLRINPILSGGLTGNSSTIISLVRSVGMSGGVIVDGGATNNKSIADQELNQTTYRCKRGQSIIRIGVTYSTPQYGSKLSVKRFKQNLRSAVVASITVCNSDLLNIARYQRPL